MVVLVSILILTGCTANDPIDNLYTKNIYPGTGRYDIGSRSRPYINGYFYNVYANSADVVALDADILTVGGVPVSTSVSQWTTDATGINYDGGNVGIGTPSEANKLLLIYDNHGGMVSGRALSVESNNASAGGTGAYISIIGAKTGDTYGARIANAASSATNAINNYGLYISSLPTWTGAGAVNYGLYIAEPTGGTKNVGAFIDGTTDLSDNKLDNVLKVNLTDPTELTINAGVVTATQGFHTVDTESDAATDNLDTINGGAIGDMLVLSGANDAREVKITRSGNVRFQPEHMIECFTFSSVLSLFGTFYSGGYYDAPAADANLTQAATTVNYGTANSPYGAHALLVSAAAGTTNAGTVSIVVSGTSITTAGVRTAGDTETIVANITTMSANKYYQTTKLWIGRITYTLTPAGGATVYAADFNYGLAAYDTFDQRNFSIKDFEIMGRAGADDASFDVKLLHHKATGWTYSAAAFVPGTTALCSLATDYSTENDLKQNERFKYERELDTAVSGTSGEGFLIKITTSIEKAVEFSNISVYAEVLPNDKHLKTTGQSVQLVYNGTNWMEQ
jgi:hypothetical protein